MGGASQPEQSEGFDPTESEPAPEVMVDRLRGRVEEFLDGGHYVLFTDPENLNINIRLYKKGQHPTLGRIGHPTLERTEYFPERGELFQERIVFYPRHIDYAKKKSSDIDPEVLGEIELIPDRPRFRLSRLRKTAEPVLTESRVQELLKIISEGRIVGSG